MKITAEKLTNQLNKQLAPIYLVAGKEPLLLQEACDTIKQHAEKHGFLQREVFTVDHRFDWAAWLCETKSMSLFSDKRYFELRLPEKTNKTMTAALNDTAKNPSPDTLVVIRAEKIDARGAWVKTIDSLGVIVQIWPINHERFPQWLRARLQHYNLSTSAEGLQLLATQLENNLLAAQQLIHQLALIHGEGKLTVEQITECLGHDAKYDIFQWVDTVLAGDATRSLNILRELRQTGSLPILLLWALSKEVRQLTQLRFQVEQGGSVSQVINHAGIWPKRKAIMQQALQRHTLQQWRQFLTTAATLDQILKGTLPGNLWDRLETFALKLCGKEVL